MVSVQILIFISVVLLYPVLVVVFQKAGLSYRSLPTIMKLSSLALLIIAAGGSAHSCSILDTKLAGPVWSIAVLHSLGAAAYALPGYGRFPVNPILKKRHESGNHEPGQTLNPGSNQRGPGNIRNDTDTSGTTPDARKPDDRNKSASPPSATPPPPPPSSGNDISPVPPTGKPGLPPAPGRNEAGPGPGPNGDNTKPARNSTAPPPPSGLPVPAPQGNNETSLNPINSDASRNSTTPPRPPIPPQAGLNNTVVEPIDSDTARNTTTPPAGSNSTEAGRLPPGFPPPAPTDPGFVAGGFRGAATKRSQLRSVRRSIELYRA